MPLFFVIIYTNAIIHKLCGINYDTNDISLSFFLFQNIVPYALYHSIYETFHAIATYLDPEFKYHLAFAQLYAELIRDFSDSVILPMDCVYYAKDIQGYVKALKAGTCGTRMLQQGLTLGKCLV